MEFKRPRVSLSAAQLEERQRWRLDHPKAPGASRFAQSSDLLKGFWKRAGLSQERVAILGSIWDRELGAFKDHWKLEAVKGATVHVTLRSSASAQELALRSHELVRRLNKHFLKPWIKNIRFKVATPGK